MSLDTYCEEILRELSIQNLPTPELVDRTTLDDSRKVNYRINAEDKLLDRGFVEQVGTKTPSGGGSETKIWSITDRGLEFVENNNLDTAVTLEDVIDQLSDIEGEIERIDNRLDKMDMKVNNRATYDKVDRSIEQIEDEVNSLSTTIEFIEGRAKEAGKSMAREKVSELKETIIENRLEEFRKNRINSLHDDMSRLQESNKRLRDKNERLEKKIDVLDERIDNMDSNGSEDDSQGFLSSLF